MRRIIKLFTSKACPNCLSIRKFLEEYGKKNKDVKIKYYNINEVDGLAESAYYEIYSVPTTLVFRDNKAIKRIMGTVEERDLL